MKIVSTRRTENKTPYIQQIVLRTDQVRLCKHSVVVLGIPEYLVNIKLSNIGIIIAADVSRRQ